MNIVIIRDRLKECLDVVSRASGDHPTLPILKNISIETNKDNITLTATNLEIGLKRKLSGKASGDGGLTVPANLLNQIISNLSDDRVEIRSKEDKLEITTDSYKAEIQGSPVDEFPSLPSVENTKKFVEVEGSVLSEAINSVLSAAQFSELRPELSSVFLQVFGDRIVLVATDSFRLAEKTLNNNQFKSSTEEEFKILLPLKTAQELVRVFAAAGPVKIYPESNQILFRDESTDFISRLLEGTFPDYQEIVPKEYQTEMTVDRDDLLGGIKLSGSMSGASLEVVLRRGQDGYLEIFSSDEKLGENAYRLEVKMDGGFKEATFNWKYLMEGVRSMPTKEVVVGLNDDNKPAIIKPKQDKSYFYILMPILR